MAKALIVLFASESFSGQLDEETKKRTISTALKSKKINADILVADNSNDSFRSKAVADILKEKGVESTRIKIIFYSNRATMAQIGEAEKFLKGNDYLIVYVASSWYHVPRIMLTWFLYSGRTTKPIFVWILSAKIFLRASLEPLKMLLSSLPIKVQNKIGEIARKIGAI